MQPIKPAITPTYRVANVPRDMAKIAQKQEAAVTAQQALATQVDRFTRAANHLVDVAATASPAAVAQAGAAAQAEQASLVATLRGTSIGAHDAGAVLPHLTSLLARLRGVAGPLAARLAKEVEVVLAEAGATRQAGERAVQATAEVVGAGAELGTHLATNMTLGAIGATVVAGGAALLGVASWPVAVVALGVFGFLSWRGPWAS